MGRKDIGGISWLLLYVAGWSLFDRGPVAG